jgi:hypothetical protein
MSLVFQNIDPHPPLRPASVCPPPLLGGGEDTLAGGRGGWGVNILEDESNNLSTELQIKKFFPGYGILIQRYFKNVFEALNLLLKNYVAESQLPGNVI